MIQGKYSKYHILNFEDRSNEAIENNYVNILSAPIKKILHSLWKRSNFNIKENISSDLSLSYKELMKKILITRNEKYIRSQLLPIRVQFCI